MPFCTEAEVQRIITTALDPADITALIVLADAEINERNITGNSDNKKQISMLISASLVASQDPKSTGVGEFRETVQTAQDYRNRAEETINRLRRPGGARG